MSWNPLRKITSSFGQSSTTVPTTSTNTDSILVQLGGIGESFGGSNSADGFLMPDEVIKLTTKVDAVESATKKINKSGKKLTENIIKFSRHECKLSEDLANSLLCQQYYPQFRELVQDWHTFNCETSEFGDNLGVAIQKMIVDPTKKLQSILNDIKNELNKHKALSESLTKLNNKIAYHYYQPLWTLVGAGIKNFESSVSNFSDLTRNLRICKLRDRAIEFIPEDNCIKLGARGYLRYNYLIVCTGIELDFQRIKGIDEAFQKDNVCSNYSPDTVEKTWQCLQNTQSGNAIFTFPNTPIKCAGAPQKIMYLADDHWRKTGKRENINVLYNSALPGIFSVPKYAKSLNAVIENRGIKTNFRHNLVEIKASENVAIFENLDTGDKVPFEYSMIHITPPQRPSPVLEPIADQAGFVDVNKETLQHVKYSNIFSAGDCSNLPTSKTAAAVASQSGVLFWNLVNVMAGREPPMKYDGYTSCPLITSYNKCILAEFNYDLKPQETFPLDQGKERRSMFFVKSTLIPLVYWLLHVTGRWSGPGKLRKFLRFGLSD